MGKQLTDGDIFSNNLELMSGLDERAIWVRSTANSLNTMVQNYNANVAQQNAQAQIDQDTLETILKILSMAVI